MSLVIMIYFAKILIAIKASGMSRIAIEMLKRGKPQKSTKLFKCFRLLWKFDVMNE